MNEFEPKQRQALREIAINILQILFPDNNLVLITVSETGLVSVAANVPPDSAHAILEACAEMRDDDKPN